MLDDEVLVNSFGAETELQFLDESLAKWFTTDWPKTASEPRRRSIRRTRFAPWYCLDRSDPVCADPVCALVLFELASSKMPSDGSARDFQGLSDPPLGVASGCVSC